MELKHVNFGYQTGQQLITDFTAQVPDGQILTILGPNGAGKSTLLGLLDGQLTPSAGQILLAGKPLTDYSLKDRAAQIAVVSQQHQLFDDMTVLEVVKIGRRPFHSLLDTVADAEVVPFLDQVQLTDYAERSLTSLSGGQQQRVWIAMALAQEPSYLFLDEPTTYLDIRYQGELMTLIKQLQQDQGITVILVLHDINQALQVSDAFWLIKKGVLVKTGSSQDVINERLLTDVFEMPVRIVDLPHYGRYVIQVPQVGERA